MDASSKLSLEENFQLLDNIISLMPGHVYWKDKEGFFLGCNEEQAKTAGLSSRHEIIGKTDYECPWKEQAHILRNSDLEVMKTGKTVIFEEPSVLANGKKAIFLSKKVPLRSPQGEIIGILGISADITELKKTQEALKKAKEKLIKNNEAKAKFLRILQHDLRNKLTGILSFSDLLLDFLDDKEQLKTGLTIINQAGKSIIPTLDRINHYLSLETGQLKPFYSTFDLHPLLKGFQDKYQHALTAKNLSMVFSLDPKLESWFIGDELLVYDVLDNLIDNAIKYTEQGTITIETHLLRKQRDNIWFDILVRDTGQGMSQGVANNIFQLFDHESSNESKKYVTPGINLSISKKIAELLGGDLLVDSREGKGTDFIFYLKLKSEKVPEEIYPIESDEIPTLAFKRKPLEPAFNKKKFSVLIVEDDPTNLEALQALLGTYFKCHVLSAQTLKTAIQLATEHPNIDLILTDIHLPDGEGHQIIPYLYKIHPSNDKRPLVVAVTAFAREVDVDYFCQQGILDVISKPITLEKLTDVICGLFSDQVIKKVHKS